MNESKSILDRKSKLWAEIKAKEQEYTRLCEQEKEIEQAKRACSSSIQNKIWQMGNLYQCETIPKEDEIDFLVHLEPNMHEFVINAKNYAILSHAQTNHKYDGLPYSHHLEMVYQYGLKYQHLVIEICIVDVLSACWVHDVIEDARQTYNDVKKVTNEVVADIAFALTNNKGKNRKERAGDDYYNLIVLTTYAPFVKLCDRLANIKYSKEKGSRMFELYKKEQHDFIVRLYNAKYSEMFAEMEELLEIKK